MRGTEDEGQGNQCQDRQRVTEAEGHGGQCFQMPRERERETETDFEPKKQRVRVKHKPRSSVTVPNINRESQRLSVKKA